MKKFITLLAVLVSSAIFFSPSVSADEEQKLINPIMPETQINNVTSYFNMQWTPNLDDKIGFTIKNTTNEDKTYSVEVNKGITNPNGVVIYNDDSQNDSVSELIKKINSPEEFTVKANSENSFIKEFNYGPNDLSGMQLLGFQVKEKNAQTKDKQFNQEMAYVLPIVLHGNVDKPEVNISFGKFEFSRVGGGLYSIKTPFVNENLNWVQDANIEVTVDKDGTNLIKDVKLTEISPQTNVAYAPTFKEDLDPGDYEVTITITTRKGKVFTNKQTVTLTKEQSKDLSNTVNIGNDKKSSIFDNLYFDLLVILISGSAGYFIGTKTRKKDK